MDLELRIVPSSLNVMTVPSVVDLTADGTPLAARALGYILAYDEVSCVIPGVRSSSQLHDNARAGDHVLSAAERARLEKFWDDYTRNGENLLPW